MGGTGNSDAGDLGGVCITNRQQTGDDIEVPLEMMGAIRKKREAIDSSEYVLASMLSALILIVLSAESALITRVSSLENCSVV